MKTLSLLLAISGVMCAQAPAPAPPEAPQPGDTVPLFRVNVVERTTNAISYRHRSGWTKVDLKGTALAPESTGHADVNSRPGYIEAKTQMHHLYPASRYGPEYLTYVLWAITPEGRAKNLGEVVLDNSSGDSHLDVTTDLQAFALVVTAEPYFGVSQPSDVVVMENIVRSDTLGKFETMAIKYDLLKRGAYTMNQPTGKYQPVLIKEKTPLQLFEAQNAVQIAGMAGADHYAADSFQKAQDLLHQAEAYELRNAGSKPVIMTAREAVQTAETARLLTLKREDDERIEREKKEAADREAAAKAQAEEQGRQREAAQAQAADEARRREMAQADAEKSRAAADASAAQAAQERAAADAARAQAETARTQMEAERQQLEQARAAALAEQQRLQAESDAARQRADQAEHDQQALRQQLLQQFNMILATRDTARGLIVNMSDVLFDTGKYTLRPAAREKLAKIAGIILGHPGLRLEVDGYTDSVGGEAYNMKLSEQRSGTVRGYLLQQGLAPDNVTAQGFGKANPVASNDTGSGRQQNRRVEMVVSGDIIGTPIGAASGAATSPATTAPGMPVQTMPPASPAPATPRP